ncbi:hypothetical protein WME79_24630 [Sorangium sp. So ce726]|uniref:hypothetical protein n=1 Tax=Sorangium sp. So ce726 TaxID=3133319 RepID=UPI003F6017AE
MPPGQGGSEDLRHSDASSDGATTSLVGAIIRTVVNRRYDHLREAGVAVFGLRQLDAHVPPIGTRTPSLSAAQPTAKAKPVSAARAPVAPPGITADP